MRRVIILIAVCIWVAVVNAQNLSQGDANVTNTQKNRGDEDDVKPEPVLVVIKDQGISVGVDIAPIITRILDKERTGIAFVGRYGFAKRWWAGAEMGFEHVKYNKDFYRQDDNGNDLLYEHEVFNYKSDGVFMRFGADYDIYMSDEYPTNNNILVGARYGYSFQSHSCSGFEIADSYWGPYNGSVSSTPVNSHWLEGVFGLRCEMLPCIYMSWTFRGKILLVSAHSDDLKPYAISGFGKTDTRVAMGFTYTIEYQLPTNRRQKR